MGAISRKEAGSVAPLSSPQDAKAVGPATPYISVENRWLAVVATPFSFSTADRPKLDGNLQNLTAALETGLLGVFRWDEFVHTEVLEKDGILTELERGHISELMVECQQRGFANISRRSFEEAVHLAAKKNPFDSAQEWLNGLPSWDGTPRIDRFLPDYLRTPDQPYERAVGEYWWTAMAARIFEPGYKVDMVPVLVGKQGSRKTTLLESIAPTLKHYGDVRLTERSVELALKVMGKIVVAWEELRGVGGRRDADEVKTFITNRYLDLRSKSKIGTDQHLRRFIIVGTSNRRDFLRDPTGHRRYLPFDVGLIDLERVTADKDQLWAEARQMVLVRKAKGQPLVDYKKVENLAVAEHQKYLDQGRWVDDERLLAWLKAGNDRFRTEDAINAVALHMPIHRPELLEMAKSLRQLGFDYRQTRVPGLTGKPKRWRQPKMSST